MNNKEEKRKMLLKVASEVLMEFGPHKITLGDIAKRAGIAKTSLYYYFIDKNDIIKSIIRNEIEYSLEMMALAADAHKTVEDKICALVEVRYYFISDRVQRLSKEIIDEFRFLTGVFESEREFYFQSIKNLIEHILREGIKKGELRHIDDTDFTAFIIIACMVGCDYAFIFSNQHERIREAIQQMVGIFFTGLRTNS